MFPITSSISEQKAERQVKCHLFPWAVMPTQLTSKHCRSENLVISILSPFKETEYSVTACALSYAYTSAKSGDPNKIQFGKALYNYYEKANYYLNTTGNE